MFKTTSLLIGGAFVTAQLVAGQGPVINTPASLIQCQPALLSWSNAVGKTYVSILPDKQISATPLVAFDPQDASTAGIKWIPNLPEDTAVTLSISDDTGVKNYSNTITVLKGGDQSCLKDGTSAAAAGSSSTTSTSAPAPAAPAPAAAVQPVSVPAASNATNTAESSSASTPLTGSSLTTNSSAPAAKPENPVKSSPPAPVTSMGKSNGTSSSATHTTTSSGAQAQAQAPAALIALAGTGLAIIAFGFGFIF